ncbi:biotin/lipoyl-binding protein [Isoptericola sp. NPDC019482]|uniref:efflux RND transporter periplasmic adaptor subunit n=1 Tax=Isoptericola sp. NPDC019482 TaxID=3154688 RepID=UPI003475F2DB
MLLQRSRSSATPSSSGVPDAPPARRGRVTLRLRGRRPGRRALLLGAVAVVVVAALVVWLTVLRPRAAAPEAAAATRAATAQASTATFEQSVTTTGTLTPAVQEDVSFAAAGTVQSVKVAEGDTVTKGQTLATVDTLQLDAALAQAKADLAQAEADLADAQDSDDGSDAAEATVEAREAAVAVAQQSADDAEATMSDATLKAPAAGLVTSVGVAVGDTVGSSGGGSASGQSGTGSTPGASGSSSGSGSSGSSGSTDAADTAAFTIVGTDAWTVDVTVGEADVASIATGDQVEMTSDDLSDTVFGTVSEIGKLPSTSQGAVAYPVTVTVTGDPDGLHDGVSVDVSIVTERRSDVLSVPAAAVTTGDDGASTVTLVGEDGSSTEQAVETGETSGQLVEITSGLSEGDTVQYTTFTPGAGRGQGTGQSDGQGGGQGDLPEGFDPSQMRGGGQGGLPEGFDPSQMRGGGQGGNS